jgi:hypothetical protein
MTYSEAITKIQAPLKGKSADQLKDMIKLLQDDMRDEAGIILDAVLDQLSQIVPSSEFCEFCESI